MTTAVLAHCRRLIRNYLEQRRRCAEYELVQLLVAEKVYPWAGDSTLALFQKHFIVQHSLYELRQHFSTRKLWLHIAPVEISLAAAEDAETKTLNVAAQQQVADFYLDLANFYTATPDTVADYLQRFWRRFEKTEAVSDPYATLGLEGAEPWPRVQRRFRELAARTHPDKGGNAETFAAVKAAYDALKASR
ncbi:DNA-J related domain-containing protein [Exilibacterium tricleocarpae]|uniref:DNA-J related domain-containing protein n=1 Tax=Exilibacterium tricleocarpae TaxID=2591008 RepID=UPI0015D35890|nr:DNA-J related domain-containing protein [Exilibacterium tricleocarpae]